jgi:ABC-2 type transport system ATP-binding protein
MTEKTIKASELQSEQIPDEAHSSSSPKSDPAIEVRHLVKHYAQTKSNAVDDITFSVQQGEIFGLLGPNGAGKTTTIRILTTGSIPTSGTVKVMGIDIATNPVRVRQRIALVTQQSTLDKRLHVRELLLFHASYHGVPRATRESRADRLLEELGLSDRAKDNVNHFSGGMAQRLMLARALMHTPDILILDEPTNSLDPQSRLFLWERIRTLNAQGITIILTTHDMDEAEQLCDRIAIMDKGRILVLDKTADLKKLVPDGTRLQISVHMPTLQDANGVQQEVSMQASLLEALQHLPHVLKGEDCTPPATDQIYQQNTLLYRLYTDDIEAIVTNVVRTVTDAGATLRDIRILQPSLEDVFITLTGRDLRS